MKRILTFILAITLLTGMPAINTFCQDAASVSVEYLNETKSLQLSGTAQGEQDDAATVLVYNYSAQLQGIADKNNPIVFDTFLLGENGSVDYKVNLPTDLVGGKYVVCIATRGSKTEKTFMHINDNLAPVALGVINASSKEAFKDVLTQKGPECGLDPDIYEANKDEISRVLYSYKNDGFQSVDSFLKLSNQATAAALIKKGTAVETVLSQYGTYLTQKDENGEVLIDCTLDYNKMDDKVKTAFSDGVVNEDFADTALFPRVFRELLIFTQFNAASSWSEIRDVLEGTKNEEKYINNEIILNPDLTSFNKLKNPDEVYRQLFKQKSQVTNYSQIAPLFESLAQTCLKAEANQQSGSSPSSGGSSFGGGSSSSGGSSSVGSSISTSGIPAITPDLIENKNTSVKLTDIEGHWAQKSIETLAKNNIISGYEDGSFKPDNGITRSEFVTLIVKGFNLNAEADISFTDVNSDNWAYPYIKKAYAAGIINGYEDGSFGLDDIITRQQAAVIIYRAISLKLTIPEGTSDFIDVGEFADYALRPILDLAGAGLIKGTGESLFSPHQITTRAQMAQLLNNALEYIAAQ